MFCVYKNGAVKTLMRGNKWFIMDDGTRQPPTIYKLWNAAELSNLSIYKFTDLSKSGYDTRYQIGIDPVDAAPLDGVVVRTTTPVYKDLSVLKTIKKEEASAERKRVSLDKIYWVNGGDKYVVDVSSSSQDWLVRATVHGNESGRPSQKWSLIAETGTTWTKTRPTFTMPQFKAMVLAVGDHVDACYDAEEAHHTAIDALTVQQDVAEYDVSTLFPVTPVHPDERGV
jgi:hypothetical protein